MNSLELFIGLFFSQKTIINEERSLRKRNKKESQHLDKLLDMNVYECKIDVLTMVRHTSRYGAITTRHKTILDVLHRLRSFAVILRVLLI